MPRPTAESSSTATADVTLIDPRAPRFGQTTTMLILLLGIWFQEPLVIAAIAILLSVAVLSKWRLNVYSLVWRHAVIPLVGKPDAPEPAAPHRFATLMGAVMSAVATILLFGGLAVSLPGLATVGYAVALVHAGMGAIGGVGDYCIGCRMYKQVALLRRIDVL